MSPHYGTKPDDKTAAFDQAQQEWTTPPLPLPEVEHVNTLITARHVWYQTVPDREPSGGRWAETEAEAEELKREAEQRLCRRIAATPNPLRGLAATLIEFADQLDGHGVVPLAVNLTTGHHEAYGPMTVDPHAVLAQVHVTVRGVRQQWVDEHTTEPGVTG